MAVGLDRAGMHLMGAISSTAGPRASVCIQMAHCSRGAEGSSVHPSVATSRRRAVHKTLERPDASFPCSEDVNKGQFVDLLNLIIVASGWGAPGLLVRQTSFRAGSAGACLILGRSSWLSRGLCGIQWSSGAAQAAVWRGALEQLESGSGMLHPISPVEPRG